jgi:tetratricopeptide (TPR) repeat protein
MWGRFEDAIKDYEQSIKLDPNNDTAYNNRADLYNYLGEYDKAIQDCCSTISLVDAERMYLPLFTSYLIHIISECILS